MLNSQKKLVQSTLPAIQKHGETITREFYKELFEVHPELKPMFASGDQENGTQAKRLAGAILAYVGNLDRLDLLSGAVTTIAKKHVSLDVRPEHYPIVGRHLLSAIQKVLGDAATPEVLDAWGAAYMELSEIMIAREQAMCEEMEELVAAR